MNSISKRRCIMDSESFCDEEECRFYVGGPVSCALEGIDRARWPHPKDRFIDNRQPVYAGPGYIIN